MKYLFSSILLICFCLPFNLTAQSGIVGTWQSTIAGREGNPMALQVTIKADNTYAVDFGADGEVEITGTYSVDGDQITVQDDAGNECTGKGVYTFKVTGDELLMERISEECEGRGGPEGKMGFSRAG